MQIVLILVALAGAVLLTLGAVLAGSLVFGAILATTRRARVLVPVFVFLVPATILGAVAGAIIVGYFAVKMNDSLIFLGPLGGLVAGGIGGVSLGSAAALYWWWRLSRSVTVSSPSNEHPTA